MAVPPKDLEDFCDRWEAAFNERLDPDAAEHIADQLLRLYARLISDHGAPSD